MHGGMGHVLVVSVLLDSVQGQQPASFAPALWGSGRTEDKT